MAAVWERLRGASSTELLGLPVQKKSRRHDREDEYYQRHQKSALDQDKVYWQDTFDRRLDALGILHHEPPKYEVQRGGRIRLKSVQIEDSEAEESLCEIVEKSPVLAPPPRNPRRRLPNISNRQPTECTHDPDTSIAALPAVSRPLQSDGAGKMDSRASVLQISPPSSPDIDSAVHKPSPGEVSPIDDDSDLKWRSGRNADYVAATPAKPHDPAPRSNIPTMRRERRKNQETAMSSRRESKLRGVMTPGPAKSTQSAGFTPQSDATRQQREGRPVDGSHVNHASTLASALEKPTEHIVTSIAGPNRTLRGVLRNTPSPSFDERVRHLEIGKKAQPIESRPAWNGASGRNAVLQPVRDDINAAPLQPLVSRGARGPPVSAINTTANPPYYPGASETPDQLGATVRRMASPKAAQSPVRPSNQQQPLQKSQNPHDGAHSYPSPPYSGSEMGLSPETTQLKQQPSATMTGNPPPPRMVIPDTEKAIKRKPPPSSANVPPQTRPVSSIYSTEQTNAHTANEEPYVQPPSRFSISTRATSEAPSPRVSNEHDRPPLPEAAISTMDRSRPRYPDENLGKVDTNGIYLSTKYAKTGPTSSEHTKQNLAQVSQRRNPDGQGRPSSVMSTDKALPPAPPELLSAHDRVGHLNARLDGLAHRKQNINLSIKQMTELMPSDNLMASKEVLAKRELERRKVEGLRMELADVKQEEYVLGLKLHRAYKRLERESEYEPTGLWVRRVTG